MKGKIGRQDFQRLLKKTSEEAEKVRKRQATLHNYIALEHDLPLSLAEAIVISARSIAVTARRVNFIHGDAESMRMLADGLLATWLKVADAMGLPQDRVAGALQDSIEKVFAPLEQGMESAFAELQELLEGKKP